MKSLGEIENLDEVDEIQELRPRHEADSTPNTYSGNYGYGPFPFHTDMAHWHLPPRYLALRCVKGEKNVATRLIDSKLIINSLGEDNLRRTISKQRRPLNGAISLLPILTKYDSENLRFRWDSLFIVPASRNSARIFSEIESRIEELAPTEFTLLEPGDTLIIDNWRILHSRSRIQSTESKRLIERSYLSTLT